MALIQMKQRNLCAYEASPQSLEITMTGSAMRRMTAVALTSIRLMWRLERYPYAGLDSIAALPTRLSCAVAAPHLYEYNMRGSNCCLYMASPGR